MDNDLNLFDGTILQLIFLVSVLPLVELFDNYNLSLLSGTIYALILSPLISLITMKLWIHRNNIKIMIVYCSTVKCKRSVNKDEIQLNDYETQLLKEVIIDDNMRRNATIVDV